MFELTRPLFGIPQERPGSDDLYTPRWVFEALGLTFDVDVASPVNPVPWIPASDHLTMADDGLSADWHGRVWCNPPYSQASLWAKRWADHRNGVILCPFSNANWTPAVIKACDVVVIPTRLEFDTPSGKPSGIPNAVWFGFVGPGVASAADGLVAARPDFAKVVPQVI